MELSALLGFAAVAVTLLIVPGPDWAYVLGAGMRDRVVMPVVSGILIGYALITVVVVVGVGAVISDVPAVLTVLTTVGALYLAWLGITTLRSARSAALQADQGTALAASQIGYLARGVGVSALNPKGLLLFLSILPQFAHSTNSLPMPAQFAVLGAEYVVLAGLIYFPLGLAAHHVLGARPGVAVQMTKVAGVAMILGGIALLGERILHSL